ncbi:glycosyltransferase family 9 protein [Orrella sp. JC864]|uniref:glycosyltransferase family 9 protein n=1 Tax=Orrella sp. JC864 TaxID=3120298 RepID=UPI0012BB6814
MTADTFSLPGAPRRIVVFRALQLGDLLCSVPALRALRRAYPQARIVLAGLPGAAGFVQRFSHYLDGLLPFPGIAAFPEQAARTQALPGFYRQARAQRFDLALQMHGSGAQSNAVVRAMGARTWAGFVPERAQAVAGLRLPWPDELPEPARYLALLRELGLPAEDATLEFPLSGSDMLQGQQLLNETGLRPERTVLVHPGARLASRRWPAERFGAVARALARQGWQIGVTGTPQEAALTACVARLAGRGAVDLCGRTDLGTLGTLVQRCRLLVCNDTGISHIAAATGTPSVVVASGSDVARWAPLNRERHRVCFADMPCRPCAYDVCPIGHPCALNVGVDQVLSCAAGQLKEAA